MDLGFVCVNTRENSCTISMELHYAHCVHDNEQCAYFGMTLNVSRLFNTHTHHNTKNHQ